MAIYDPLDDRAAALMAFAQQGWKQALAAMDAIYSTIAPSPAEMVLLTAEQREEAARLAGRTLFDIGTSAIRWLVHRRIAYGFGDDPWPLESAFNWSWRAARIERGEQCQTTDAHIALLQEHIDSYSIVELDIADFNQPLSGSNSDFSNRRRDRLTDALVPLGLVAWNHEKSSVKPGAGAIDLVCGPKERSVLDVEFIEPSRDAESFPTAPPTVIKKSPEPLDKTTGTPPGERLNGPATPGTAIEVLRWRVRERQRSRCSN